MIDLHCHLLPGIDDGPRTLEEALELARIASDNGIRKSVVTPHIHPGRYENDLRIISEAVAAFRVALAEHDIPLQLGIGGEVRIGPELMIMLQQETIPFLGELDGYRIMLLEFPHSHIPPGSDKLVNWLLQRNIRPLIAHPERNKDVLRHLDKITPFVQMGCLLQVTAGSVAGAFGPAAQTRAVELLECGWVTILASDAHNREHRPPDLEPGRRAAAEIVGEEASWRMVRDVPEEIIGERGSGLGVRSA
jgi:protein-tyrosine phosphatase